MLLETRSSICVAATAVIGVVTQAAIRLWVAAGKRCRAGFGLQHRKFAS
jgi:hypothetical protein